MTVFSPLHTKVSYQFTSPSRKLQITVRFTGHSRIVGPQYGMALASCDQSDVWNLDMAPSFLENFWTAGLIHGIDFCTSPLY
jgi:hypothetical protein